MRRELSRSGSFAGHGLVLLHVADGVLGVGCRGADGFGDVLRSVGSVNMHDRPLRGDRRVVDDAPTGRVDLHRPPFLVAKIDIEPPVQPADADMHNALGAVEMRLGLDHVERGL